MSDHVESEGIVGQVLEHAARTTAYAILTEEGDFAVVDVSDTEALLDKEFVFGSLVSLGPQQLLNLSRRVTVDAFVKAARCSRGRALELLASG